MIIMINDITYNHTCIHTKHPSRYKATLSFGNDDITLI